VYTSLVAPSSFVKLQKTQEGDPFYRKKFGKTNPFKMGKTEKCFICYYDVRNAFKALQFIVFSESEHCGKFPFQRNGFFKLLTLMLRQEI